MKDVMFMLALQVSLLPGPAGVGGVSKDADKPVQDVV